MRALSLLVVALLAGAGCLAKTHAPPGRDDQPLPEERSLGVPPGPTLEYVRSLLASECTLCHAGRNASEKLHLTPCPEVMTGDSPPTECDMADLLDVESTQIPGRLRIKRGDPENSYLVDKLRDNACNADLCDDDPASCKAGSWCGDRMPQDGPYLSEEDIGFIAGWISSLGADVPPADMTP